MTAPGESPSALQLLARLLGRLPGRERPRAHARLLPAWRLDDLGVVLHPGFGELRFERLRLCPRRRRRRPARRRPRLQDGLGALGVAVASRRLGWRGARHRLRLGRCLRRLRFRPIAGLAGIGAHVRRPRHAPPCLSVEAGAAAGAPGAAFGGGATGAGLSAPVSGRGISTVRFVADRLRLDVEHHRQDDHERERRARWRRSAAGGLVARARASRRYPASRHPRRRGARGHHSATV